jgi:DNA-3-methyladenine glycosylase I
VPRERFRLTAGADLVRAYKPKGGAVKAFCVKCGSSLFGGTWPDGPEVSIRLGALDGDPGIRPQYHTFVASRAPWDEITDDLPQYPGALPAADAPGVRRCEWARTELSVAYHDREWGVPLHDDRRLFEFLVLEGAQAGLSWETILKKRPAYRRAFGGFDPRKVARYDARHVKRLLSDPGIVRNRLKVRAAIGNAQAFLAVREELGSFDAYVWGFVGGKPKRNRWKTLKEVPPRSPEGDALSRDLTARGFRFVGPTIIYAFMQAVGMVNDHVVGCFRHGQV